MLFFQMHNIAFCFLQRISLSPYKHNFIIKGGFLVSAIVGLDTRATMDLDTTIKGFTLTHEAILSIFKDTLSWEHRGITHTVMGNIPYDEIMKIAEGIR